MQKHRQKTVSFANSPTLIALNKTPNDKSISKSLVNSHGNNLHDNDDNDDISYYFCENSRKEFRGAQQKYRRYCSFCRKTHEKFSSREGIERLFRNTTRANKRLNSVSSSNDSDVSSEESFVTRINSEFGQTRSSSLNSLSVEGEKMYKAPLDMAKERVMKRHNVSRESIYGDSSHGDDFSRRVSINIVLPSIVYDSDQFP